MMKLDLRDGLRPDIAQFIDRCDDFHQRMLSNRRLRILIRRSASGY